MTYLENQNFQYDTQIELTTQKKNSMKIIYQQIVSISMLLLVITVQSQNNLVTVTIEGSRLVEQKNQLDSGLDIIATLYFDRDIKHEKFIRIEWFKNINFLKVGFGVQKKMNITPKFEMALGVEGSIIYIEKPTQWAWGSFLSYALNGDVKYRLGSKLHAIGSYNYQRRTDFNMYGNGSDKIGEFVGTPSFGLGYSF